MTQRRFLISALHSPDFSPTTTGATLIGCFALSLVQGFLIMLNPIMGLAGMAAIVLVLLFSIRTELALPLYILVAAPTMVLSSNSSGILSHLYIGDLLFVLIVAIWQLRSIAVRHKMRLTRSEMSIVIPLICLIVIGTTSIVISRLFPDPLVTYAFRHSDVPLLVVNIIEVLLLASLPLLIIIVSTMIRTLKDARLMIWAYLLVGLPYALGTIFAGPLHLYSQFTLLGVQRPEVFGTIGSGLGILNLLFACLAFGQTLYARKESTRLGFGLLTCIYVAGVIMSFGRESWLGLLLAVWVISWFRFKSPFVLLLPLVILLVMLAFPGPFSGLFAFFDPTKVYGLDRLVMWQDAISIWLRHPYFGAGAGNYQFFDLAYGTDFGGIAHNQFLEVLAEMGVQGLACLVLTIMIIGRVTLKCFRSAESDTGKALALAYLGYFVSLLLAGFFTDPFLPSTAASGGTGAFIGGSYLWLFLGLVLSIPRWDREAANQELSTIRESAESVE